MVHPIFYRSGAGFGGQYSKMGEGLKTAAAGLTFQLPSTYGKFILMIRIVNLLTNGHSIFCPCEVVWIEDIFSNRFFSGPLASP